MRNQESMIVEVPEHFASIDDGRGIPWFGNPWYFDVKCAGCGHEYPNSMFCCPACDDDRVIAP